ncbi:lasso peptide biosynthesis B2 protein [Streptomyces sp. NPDC047061]|uniref:lasso peptide biosynthesis B2 protein n=1 Tax=Streptomyces sp. NPDC047061 TaxID=3154605 RepID=UPI0034078308
MHGDAHPARRAPRPLGDGDLAVLSVRTGQWHWMNHTTERVWAAALDNPVPELASQLRAEGMTGPIGTLAAQTVAFLTRAGLLTNDGPGNSTLPPQPPLLNRPVPAASDDPPLGPRLRAGIGLLLALGLMKLPLRIRMALVDQVRTLPVASGQQTATAHAAVLRMRPAWWPARIACMEVSLATVVTVALGDRRAHWELGARHCPAEAHAWVWTPEGAVGLSGRDADDPRRPWTAVATTPPVRPNE